MTRLFRKCWKAMGLDDESLKDLENLLLENPQRGDVIEGTGGARKMRIQINDNRGKSGGGRVIYVDIFEKEKIYLLFAYPKNVQENLTPDQKKAIKRIIDEIRGVTVMAEIKFKSNLSEAEIENNFKGIDFFSGIMSGLEEALAYEKGTARAATFARKRSLPDVNVAATRKDLKLSQKAFASVLGVSTRTVEAWETGKSNPSPTARNLIFLISQDHTLVSKLQARV